MKTGRFVLELLFPTRCVICREFLNGGKPRICPSCAEKLPYTAGGGKSKGDFYSLCVSSVYYEKDMREAILRYKFLGARGYHQAFGTLLASTVYEHLYGKFDVITWAPLNRAHLRKRGYDQALLLAEGVGEKLCMKPQRLLQKKRGISAQSASGSPERRRANIAGAYSVIDPAQVEGKRILVIDDIITSGATLSECAKTLLMSGADDVYCATLARTREK